VLNSQQHAKCGIASKTFIWFISRGSPLKCFKWVLATFLKDFYAVTADDLLISKLFANPLELKQTRRLKKLTVANGFCSAMPDLARFKLVRQSL
jgi:hypothetical protein